MAEWLEALVLGIVQGLTEFLPVSSSGHLELGKAVLGYHPNEGLLFSVVLHFATMLSTLVVFRKEILEIFSGLLKFKANEQTAYSFKIFLSMIPIGFVGVFFKKDLEQFFENNLLFVGSMLCLTAALLLFSHFYKPKHRGEVGFLQAFLIGLAQAIAVLPGISRSGATIATALILGVEKSKAAKFSFLMVLAPIAGATILETKEYFDGLAQAPQGSDAVSNHLLIELSVDFFAAFICGIFACKLMINLVKKGKLSWFAYYCFTVGTIAILYALFVAKV